MYLIYYNFNSFNKTNGQSCCKENQNYKYFGMEEVYALKVVGLHNQKQLPVSIQSCPCDPPCNAIAHKIISSRIV
jgi:hypothetical protein